MTANDAMIVVGLSVIGGILLHRAYVWARRNLGTCRDCKTKRRLCYCMGGPK